MIDSDTQVQRGFVQHRRSRISGVNGEGQPLPSQVLEGEIAINLITRKLYTKRQMFSTFQYAQTVAAFDNTAGFKITISDLDFDSDATTITYSINGNSKSLVLDSDSLISDIITQIKNAAIAEVGAAQVTSDASSVTFFKTTGSSASINFSTDFVKYIDFHYIPVIRVELNTSISLNSSSASTIIDFDLATTGFRRTFGNGRLISHSGSYLYLIDFSGSLAIGYKVTQRNPRDEYEIIELNNIPIVKPTAPEKALNNGNFWIENKDSESGQLYWLDASVTDDSDFQNELRNADSDYRVNNNLVVIDSDGNGNLLYAEWRKIVSTSLVGDTIFEGDYHFKGSVTIDSDLIFDNKRFTDTTMFTVKDVNSNIVIAGHLLQIDSDLPEPGLEAS
jgi:hypothetical protein|tara:strand:+ start:8654 stop:9826 length:1173 start_codon:yes stop_codon:yes gene_type:complete